MTNLLMQLSGVTTIVADTGELAAIKNYQPQDATTNPSLILKAAQNPEYVPLLAQVIAQVKEVFPADCQLEETADRLIVAIGCEVLKHIPGRISTEVDARLSFDVQATLAKARKLIALYAEQGISRDRVLIKIAATWEGIVAAKQLEQEGINCNLTLLFNFAQARACAEAGVYLISPFVGRILDWYRSNDGRDYPAGEDPGVKSVQAIYRYYKQHGYRTVVMGASFRNVEQITALAGCDRLTISPALLADLQQREGQLVRQLADSGEFLPRPQGLTEAEFRWQLNEDVMASSKLAEGIRGFAADQHTLEQQLTALLQA